MSWSVVCLGKGRNRIKTESIKAVILDRDGTIIEDTGYLNEPERVRLLPGVVEGLKQLKKHLFRFFIITNQSGLARGLIRPKELEAVNAKMMQFLGENDIQIERIYVCPHGPEDACDCRKPAPGLVRQLVSEYAINCSQSFIIGDRLRDIAAGSEARIDGILLGKDRSEKAPGNLIYKARDFTEATKHILEMNKRTGVDTVTMKTENV